MSGARPNVIDLLESGLVDYIISTSPHGRDPHRDSVKFRRKATEPSIPTITAMDTARVLVDALRGDHDISQMELVDIANLHREAAKGEERSSKQTASARMRFLFFFWPPQGAPPAGGRESFPR